MLKAKIFSKKDEDKAAYRGVGMSTNSYSGLDTCKPRLSVEHAAGWVSSGTFPLSVGGFWTEIGLLSQESCLHWALR